LLIGVRCNCRTNPDEQPLEAAGQAYSAGVQQAFIEIPSEVTVARLPAAGFAPERPGGDTPAMPLFARKPELPADLHEAWRAFLDCAEVIEGGRRVLLATLPTGRVEPAPIGVGTDAVRRAIADAREWMPRWHLEQLEAEWQDCQQGLDEALRACDEANEVAGSTDELEELLTAVQDVVEALDVFADAERAWRRLWKLPRDPA